MIERIKLNGIRALLAAFILGTLVLEVFRPESDLGRFETPLVLIGLLLVIETSVSLGDGLKALTSRTQAVEQSIQTLAESGSARVTTYANTQEFYRAMLDELEKTTYTLDVTHIRKQAPTDFGAAADGWFGKTKDWVAADQRRSIRRIISAGSPEVIDWARRFQPEIAGLSFYVGVTNWPLTIPAVNVAIMDSRTLFMALPGSTPERSPGLRIEDPTTVNHFLTAFEALSKEAVPFPEWLSQQNAT